MSESENLQHFGPCSNLHGHNYLLEVTVSGEPCRKTGMILDVTVLDQLVQEHVLFFVDHRYLDEDVPWLSGVLTTVENVAQIFYQRLAPLVPGPAELYRVRLFESELNWVDVF